jgi:hypothetical protein
LRRRTIALLALAAPVVSACGTTTLSVAQLRTQATAICIRAEHRLQAIGAPASQSQAREFLQSGTEALAPEVDQLRSLTGSGDAGKVYAAAVSAVTGELAALRGAVRSLDRGGQTVSVLRSVQERLAPLENQADGAWRALQIPACLTR